MTFKIAEIKAVEHSYRKIKWVANEVVNRNTSLDYQRLW